MKSSRTSGQIVKRGERKFVVRVYLGEVGGKRRYLNQTVHGNKKDAQVVLNNLLRQRDMGTLAEPSRLALDEYLDHWLEAAVKGRVSGRTYSSYKGLLNRHVRPALGGKRLGKITPVEIQKLYSDMQAKGLSARTVRYTHTVLKNALEQAIKWRMTAVNPARYVDLPKQRRKEMRALSSAEAHRFLAAAQSSPYHVLFNVLVTTGLRPGEALGLKWADLDLAAGTLTVQRAVTYDADGKVVTEQPKTSKSRRTVPLPESLVKLLLEHRDAQTPANELVFPSATGGLLHPDNFPKRAFKDVLKAAGLPEAVRLYDLRHTCATLLLQAGVHTKIVSERLGHASIVLTADTYSHVLPTMQREASDKLEAMLYGKQESQENEEGRPLN